MTDTIPIDRDRLDRIAELLETCDEFLRAQLSRIDRDLDELLLNRGITGGPGWLIDTIGLTALHLRITASHPAHDQEKGQR